MIYSRFDGYRNGTGLENFDSQKRFMEQALGLIGFTRIHSIVVVESPPGSLTSSDPENSQAKSLLHKSLLMFSKLRVSLEG